MTTAQAMTTFRALKRMRHSSRRRKEVAEPEILLQEQQQDVDDVDTDRVRGAMIGSEAEGGVHASRDDHV